MSSLLAQGPAPIEVPSIDYGALAPVLIILAAACVAVLVEAFLPRYQRWAAQVVLSLGAIVVAGITLGAYAGTSPPQGITTIADAVAVDRPTLFLWGTLLALALASVLLIADRSVEPGGAFIASAAARVAARTGVGGGNGRLGGADEPDYGPPGRSADAPLGADARSAGAPLGAPTMQTEVFPFTLFALAGMMTFVAANDLLIMFVALEVLSLPLYLMCGLARRRRLLSQEAAVKYFLLGAFASAFFLYGLALLYGYAGSVKLADIATAASGAQRSDTLLMAGLGLLMVGLLFKASTGPFHTWTPDVYQGAPTAITAFMGSATKVAAFGAMARVLFVAFGDTRWEWRPVLWAVAIVSMVIGAVLGLTQTDIKRMVAYSSIAHAGFLLLGAMTITAAGTSGLLFYLLAYAFNTLAIFAVITLVRDANGEAGHLSQWAGLAKRSPVVAGVMTFLLLGLAGVPLTSGFTAKFAVFSAALGDGMAPLVVIALIASAVAAFYYVRVIVLMYFSEPAADGPTVSIPGAFTTAAITLGVIITLLLGIVPSLALGWAGAGGFVS